MPETTFNRVGLTYQAPTGSLIMDDEIGRLQFTDSKGVVTVLVDRSRSPLEVLPVLRATWSELGREASLQLYLEGYDHANDLQHQQQRNRPTDNGDQEMKDGEEGDGNERNGKEKNKITSYFHRIHGLNVKDNDKFRDFLSNFCSPYRIILDNEPWDVRGANYGWLEISNLKRCIVLNNFEDRSRPMMEVPLANVSQIAAPSKNEVEIQYTFAQPDANAKVTDKFELSVCRLYVHPSEEDEEENEPTLQQPEDGEDGIEEFAEKVRRKMKLVADLYDESDEASLGLLCQIDERWCNFNAPRGKYRIDCYKDFFRMRGKTYDFKIPYSTITQMHLLDHPETLSKFLVISLNVPLRSGQQRYSHLVMTIDDVTSDLDMLISENEIVEKYGTESGLAPKMNGNMPEQIAKLLKVLSQKKVFVMPQTGFFAAKEDGDIGDSSQAPDRCVKCSYKTTQGFLFPMKSSLIFLHKPVLYIRYDKIDSIHFKRSTADSKIFDLSKFHVILEPSVFVAEVV
jgi:structure-specific recognition protein 1